MDCVDIWGEGDKFFIVLYFLGVMWNEEIVFSSLLMFFFFEVGYVVEGIER